METYEEKYKDLVKRLNKAREEKGVYTFNSVLDAVAPELKESEDKKMIQYFEDLAPFHEAEELYEKYGFSHKEAIAWIEKQCEHKKFLDSIQVGDKVTRNEDGVLVNLSQLNRIAKKDEKQGERRSKLIDFALNANDSDLQEATYFIPKGFHAEIIGDKVVIKKGERQPWSEEDEKKLNTTIAYLLDVEDFPLNAKKCINWLKELKNRVQPQPQQEWSEEVLVAIDSAVEALSKDLPSLAASIRRLKSLSPQYSWKPSKEQIKALEEASNEHWEPDGLDPLYTLLQDLKKLMEA